MRPGELQPGQKRTDEGGTTPSGRQGWVWWQPLALFLGFLAWFFRYDGLVPSGSQLCLLRLDRWTGAVEMVMDRPESDNRLWLLSALSVAAFGAARGWNLQGATSPASERRAALATLFLCACYFTAVFGPWHLPIVGRIPQNSADLGLVVLLAFYAEGRRRNSRPSKGPDQGNPVL